MAFLSTRMHDAGGLMPALSGRSSDAALGKRASSTGQAHGEPADARHGRPAGRISLEEAGSEPARAVVTPPHLPAKTNGFYALMRPALTAAWRGPRGGRRADSSMQFYAPWLCSLGVADASTVLGGVVTTGSATRS